MGNPVSPEIYELAFSYRDYEAEVDFLELCFQEHCMTENTRVLDIACGIGEHLRQFCERGYPVDGFDLDAEAVEYARSKSEGEGLPFNVWTGDMRNFSVDEPYGLAVNMLTAVNFLHTNEEIISHLRCVAEALVAGGVYVLEMAHPREYGAQSGIPSTAWEIQHDDLYIECDLNHKQKALDPIAQTQGYTIRIDVTKNDKVSTYYLDRKIRVYLLHEFRALVQAAGGFEWVECYGAFNPERRLDNSKRSLRMIPVLRRIE